MYISELFCDSSSYSFLEDLGSLRYVNGIPVTGREDP
jgi:hypothetical protein